LTSPEQREGYQGSSGLVMGRQQATHSPSRPRPRYIAAGGNGGEGGARQSPVLQTCVTCCTEDGAAELEAELGSLLQSIAAEEGSFGTPTRARSG
jgi:hypothetical protein